MSEHDPQGYEVTNLPQLQSADELKAQQPPDFLKNDEWFGTVINKDEWLDFKEAYTKPNFLLSFRGRPFARMGDVQVISGQAGHGKSMLLSQIITAIFHGDATRLFTGSIMYHQNEPAKVKALNIIQKIRNLNFY